MCRGGVVVGVVLFRNCFVRNVGYLTEQRSRCCVCSGLKKWERWGCLVMLCYGRNYLYRYIYDDGTRVRGIVK